MRRPRAAAYARYVRRQPEPTQSLKLERAVHPVAQELTFAMRNQPDLEGEVLVETKDGRTLRGKSAIWGFDPDNLSLQDGVAEIRIPFDEVRAVSRKGLRPGRVSVLVTGVLLAGAYLGQRFLQGKAELEFRDTIFLGVLGAAPSKPRTGVAVAGRSVVGSIHDDLPKG